MSLRPDKGRLGWFAAFVLLLIAAAWLMSAGEPEGQKPAPRVVDFPRGMRQPEWERLERRRTLAARPHTDPTPAPAPSLPRREPPTQDPLLRAFAPAPGRSHIVMEANALRHAPLGQLLIDCLLAQDPGWLDEVKELSGIDPLEDLDRIAVSGENVILTGNFSNARFEDLSGRPYGAHGTIYSSDGDLSLATWRGEMIVMGSGESGELEAAIDRLEGRSPGSPPFAESLSYGEVYGVIAIEELRRLGGGGHDPIFDRLAEVASGIELHVDAMNDFALRAEVHGEDASALEELSRTLGGALSLARLRAKTSGEEEAAEFLSYAGVDRFGGGFAFELALPLENVRKHLEEVCPGPRVEGPAPSLPAD